jgi:hypothetical protein
MGAVLDIGYAINQKLSLDNIELLFEHECALII